MQLEEALAVAQVALLPVFVVVAEILLRVADQVAGNLPVLVTID